MENQNLATTALEINGDLCHELLVKKYKANFVILITLTIPNGKSKLKINFTNCSVWKTLKTMLVR